MFSLRIHTLDTPRVGGAAGEGGRGNDPSPPSASSSAPPTTKPPQAAAATRNPNPRIQECRGAVHLYRNVSSTPSSLDSFLPDGRGTVLFVVAVPSYLSKEDLYRFFCSGSYADHFVELWIIRNDATEDRYSVLITLDDQKSADKFYFDINGWRFPSAEAEVCHSLFTASVEYTDSTEIVSTPPSGSTELPTCPVCLERLDQDTSGIVTTGCDHSFQCSCISKWANSSCPVCRLCQQQAEKPTCSVCETLEKLWICMICGFVGCGRYKEGHAFRHWKDTQHCYSLDLEAQRVWDYVGDTYVHRLNQSKSDEKLVKMKMQDRSVNEACGTCECGVDSGISGALFSSKVEAIVDEYNRLLTSQLENQRQYYESLLLEAKGKREKVISEAVEKAVSEKLQNIHLEIENTIVEKKMIADINDDLIKSQNTWREKIKEIEESAMLTLKLKDEKIHELEEEIRDYKVFLKAQKTLNDMESGEEIRGGTVMPVPLQQSSHASPRRSSKMDRRRH